MFTILKSVIFCVCIVELNATNPLINKAKDFINTLELPKRLATNEDARLSFVERANKYGYPSEAHTTTTEDGYILTIFRIVKGKNCKSEKKKVPVLLQHGVLASGISWLDAGPDAGPAYLLADACYDVWCGTIRGVGPSKRHITLDPKTDPKFWDFSFHEMGTYDLPAMIDYVLENTGSKTLNYIGYSQGGMMYYVMGSTRSEYLEKIGVGITMAPAAWMKHTGHALIQLGALKFEEISKFFKLMDKNEIGDRNSPLMQSLEITCNPKLVAGTLCTFLFGLLDGDHPGSITPHTISTLMGHFPDSTSVKNLAHYSQNIRSGNFQMFNYGEEENIDVYGTPLPPDYNVSSITTPVCLFYGENDKFVVPKDVATLRSKLRNVVDYSAIGDSKYNHNDFMYSRHIPKLLIPKIEACLIKYS